MSKTLNVIIELVSRREVRISSHGYDELVADDILVREVIGGIADSILIEDYPDYPKGPCVLVLQRDQKDMPVNVVWGIPKDASAPAVLVTAYRPDPNLWTSDCKRREI